MWPCAGEDILASAEVEEADTGRVQVDVEAVADIGDDLFLAGIVVAGVDDAERVRVALLSRQNCREEHTFASSTSITEWMEEADHSLV